MPLKIFRADDNAGLWNRCVASFLERADAPGPAGHRDWAWLSHRNLRDRLLDTAQAAGHPGWLDPPVTFFGDLASLFDIRETPVGLLTRRRILARHAARLGRDILGRATPQAGGIVRSHVLDSLLADLLPEGVEPDELRDALNQLPGDTFTDVRDEWIVATYAAYRDELARLGRPDWRAVNAILAERIEAGELPTVLRGAERLHVYGITSPRTRRRLLTALAGQADVEVRLYLLREPETDAFFDGLTDDVEHVERAAAEAAPVAAPASLSADEAPLSLFDSPADPPADAPPAPAAPAEASTAPAPTLHVQPAPDAAREMEWVAREVKQLITSGEAEPHEIAVVARSGREDTRRAYRALTKAGVPATARIRTPLAEITALKALLLVFRGAARDWDYRSLRAVLDHPYFDTKVDLRGIDFIASARRVTGLPAWREKLEHALRLVEQEARETWGEGLYADRIAKDIAAFDAVREKLEPLGRTRTEAEWIDLTIDLLKEERGLFFLRRRLCDPVGDRWDLVRLDQRGVIQLERLLREWRDLEPDADEPCKPDEWYAMLRRLLEANELVLSTPGQKGVQVLEAHDAGLVPFAHTFVVHANDGEFPLAPRTNAVLSNEERAGLAALGIPVDYRENALRRERSLWRAVTGQAGGVRVSYRTTNPSGTPLLPSLMVPKHEASNELPRLRRPVDRVSVSPEDADQEAAFTLASRLGAADRAPEAAAGTDPGPAAATAQRTAPTPRIQIAPCHPELLRQAIVAAVAESHRGPGLARAAEPENHPALRPNPWNGQLRDPEVLRVLRETFDESYRWSASKLEQYARVPFQFLLQRILRVDPKEEAEEETSPLAFGSVAHEILEKFYTEYCDRLPSGLDEECRARIDEIAEAVFAAREAAGDWLGLPALWETSRESMRRSVHEFIEWELAILHKSGERPYRMEHEFGFDGELVSLEGRDLHGRAVSLRLCGKIDRVDWSGSRESPTLHVLDYKSGYVPVAPDYQDGTILQGVLYLETLAGEGHRVQHGKYRSIRKRGTQNAGKITYGSEQYATALALAMTIPSRVRAGLFEPVVSRRSEWKDWDAALEIRRTSAQVREGHRFEADVLENLPPRADAEIDPADLSAPEEAR